MTAEPIPDPLPASARRGEPGHDQAEDRITTARLIRLRRDGMSYQQIAEQTGYADGSGARQALLRALDRHEADSARELRILENAALDADQLALRAIITDRSIDPAIRIRAIDARTRLSARRARLNGLDAPVQVAVSSEAVARLDAVLAEADEFMRTVVPGQVLSEHDDTDSEDSDDGE